MDTPIVVGTEWLVEAAGCDENALGDEALLKSIFADIIRDLGLKTVGDAIWHKFPGAGGVTGLVALTESHLACHTYPEHGIATFNLYCCKDRPFWNWEERLTALLDAGRVSVRKITRSIPQDQSGKTALHGAGIEASAAGGDV